MKAYNIHMHVQYNGYYQGVGRLSMKECCCIILKIQNGSNVMFKTLSITRSLARGGSEGSANPSDSVLIR